MYCLLCNFNSFKDDDVIETQETLERLKSHYISHHLINENNFHFKELFLPDSVSKRCEKCRMEFRNCKDEKNHNFSMHYHQVGGSGANDQLLMNVLERGQTK